MADNRELFEYAKDIHGAGIDQFKHLEEKADRYLTTFGLLLAASSVLVGIVFDRFVPPIGYLQCSMIATVFLISIALVVSGLFVFKAMEPKRLALPPLTDEVIQKLSGESDGTINEVLTQTLKEAATLNKSIIEAKATALKRSYWTILVTTGLLASFALLVFIQKWHAG